MSASCFEAADGTVRLQQVPRAGRGVVAQRELPAGERLIAVPLDSMWPSAEQVRASTTWDGIEEVSDEAVLAIWLLLERAKGDSSKHAAAIAQLPSEFDTLLHSSDEEFAELRGSCLYRMADEFRQETKLEYEVQHEALAQVGCTGVDFAAFTWATSVFTSRQLSLEAEPGKPATHVVPGFDMFNHDPTGSANCEFNVEDGHVVVRTCRAIAAEEECLISYGPLGSGSLLLFHGFVARPNPFDTVEIMLTFTMAADRVKLLRALESAEADEGIANPFQVAGEEAGEVVILSNLTKSRPLPSSLLAALRVSRFSAEELEKQSITALCAPPGSLSDTVGQGEALAMQACAAILQSYLSAYPTSLTEDRALHEAEATTLPSRKRIALELRIAEKEILESALDKVRPSLPY